tara:strand:+ start:1598 stop:2419 length:822 start_codon:yes stop_codon:yes gene_type:complete
MIRISAYIPCYNNEKTIESAISSIIGQAYPIDDFFIIDDGSTDDTLRIVQQFKLQTHKNADNKGRGFVRNLSTTLAKNQFILCLDASKSLEPNFVKNGIQHFQDPTISAVIGRIGQDTTHNYLDRWRKIHLFKTEQVYSTPIECGLITYGALMRKNAILDAGNYNPSLIHSEDADLGKRLIQNGWKVILDPNLSVNSLTSDSFWKLLERYWRWYAGQNNDVSLQSYFQNLRYSLSYMVKKDIQDRDFHRLKLSLICPHYQFIKSIISRKGGST